MVNRDLGRAAIEADNVRFTYPGGVEALADLSFRAGRRIRGLDRGERFR